MWKIVAGFVFLGSILCAAVIDDHALIWTVAAGASGMYMGTEIDFFRAVDDLPNALAEIGTKMRRQK